MTKKKKTPYGIEIPPLTLTELTGNGKATSLDSNNDTVNSIIRTRTLSYNYTIRISIIDLGQNPNPNSKPSTNIDLSNILETLRQLVEAVRNINDRISRLETLLQQAQQQQQEIQTVTKRRKRRKRSISKRGDARESIELEEKEKLVSIEESEKKITIEREVSQEKQEKAKQDNKPSSDVIPDFLRDNPWIVIIRKRNEH